MSSHWTTALRGTSQTGSGADTVGSRSPSFTPDPETRGTPPVGTGTIVVPRLHKGPTSPLRGWGVPRPLRLNESFGWKCGTGR